MSGLLIPSVDVDVESQFKANYDYSTKWTREDKGWVGGNAAKYSVTKKQNKIKDAALGLMYRRQFCDDMF